MNVKKIIDQLKNYPPETEICLAFWDKKFVDGLLYKKLTEYQWLSVVDKFENEEDFSDINDNLSSYAIEAQELEGTDEDMEGDLNEGDTEDDVDD
jgi:hypothetical protein